MQIGYIILYFDKYINCTSINMNNIILQYNYFLGTSNLYYILTNTFIPVCTTQSSKNVRINFGVLNLLVLKSYISLLKSNTTSYLRKC